MCKTNLGKFGSRPHFNCKSLQCIKLALFLVQSTAHETKILFFWHLTKDYLKEIQLPCFIKVKQTKHSSQLSPSITSKTRWGWGWGVTSPTRQKHF